MKIYILMVLMGMIAVFANIPEARKTASPKEG